MWLSWRGPQGGGGGWMAGNVRIGTKVRRERTGLLDDRVTEAGGTWLVRRVAENVEARQQGRVLVVRLAQVDNLPERDVRVRPARIVRRWWQLRRGRAGDVAVEGEIEVVALARGVEGGGHVERTKLEPDRVRVDDGPVKAVLELHKGRSRASRQETQEGEGRQQRSAIPSGVRRGCSSRRNDALGCRWYPWPKSVGPWSWSWSSPWPWPVSLDVFDRPLASNSVAARSPNSFPATMGRRRIGWQDARRDRSWLTRGRHPCPRT